MSIKQQIVNFVRQWPGRTQREIALGTLGPGAVQPRVNQACALLVAQKLIVQRGAGGAANPFRYYPA